LKTQGNTYLNGEVGIGTDSPFGKLTVNTQGVGWNFPSLLLIDEAIDNTGGAILQFRNPADKRMYLQSHFGTQSDGTDSYMTFSHNAFYNMRLRGDGNLGIGSLNPNLAGLVVNKKVGNSHAIFGDNTSGVSIESNFPGIHFNSYFNGSRKTISSGFTAGAEMNPTTGDFSIYTSPTSTIAGSTASIFERLKITKDGVVNVGASFILNNPNALNTGVSNNISFGGSNYTTGFISTIGTSNSAARMAFYTGYSFTGGASSMQERLTISNTGNVGIANTNPTQKLEVNGKIKIADDANTAVAGNVRWNSVRNDFEGYDGSEWLSLTKSKNEGWGGNDDLYENEKFESGLTGNNLKRQFGHSIAVNGNSALIGTYYNWNSESGEPNLIGKVILFHYNEISEEWTEGITIVPSDGMPGDHFGYSVAWASGGIVVGAPEANVVTTGGTLVGAGKVYIFNSLGTELYKINGQTREDNFGYSVAINSTGHILIGAPGWVYSLPPQNDGRGKVYAYFLGFLGLEFINQFTDPTGGVNQHFGENVEITRDYYALIGNVTGKIITFHYGSNGSGIYLYQFNSNLTFSETGHSGVRINFDISTEGNGNLIVPGVGKAFVFYKSGGTFTEQQIIRFGSNADLTSAIIKEDYAVLSSIGRVDVFKKYNGIWTQKTSLKPSSPTTNFGSLVKLHNDKNILVAAQLANASKGLIFMYKK
jgi:hypothetical protein